MGDGGSWFPEIDFSGNRKKPLKKRLHRWPSAQPRTPRLAIKEKRSNGAMAASGSPKRPPRVVGERENVFKRLNYIWQASRLAALREKKGKESISRFYARQGKRLTERLCVRIADGASFGCAGCGVALVLGSTATARVRVRGRRRSKARARPRDARLVLRCLRCGHVTRRRVKSSRRPKAVRTTEQRCGEDSRGGEGQRGAEGKESDGRGVAQSDGRGGQNH